MDCMSNRKRRLTPYNPQRQRAMIRFYLSEVEVDEDEVRQEIQARQEAERQEEEREEVEERERILAIDDYRPEEGSPSDQMGIMLYH
jgi:hypothetical protein